MNMGIIRISLPRRIVRNVETLIAKVRVIANPVLVISRVPHLTRALLTHRVRVAALHQLNAPRRTLIDRRCNQHVHVIRHHCKGMQLESSSVAISKERRDKELSVYRALKMSPLLKR